MAGVVAQTELPDEVLAVPAVLARVLPPVPVAGRRVAWVGVVGEEVGGAEEGEGGDAEAVGDAEQHQGLFIKYCSNWPMHECQTKGL